MIYLIFKYIKGNCDNIPPGYEAVSLIEALNGPCIPRQPPAAIPDLVETPDSEPAMQQAAQILNRHSDRTPNKSKDIDNNAPEVTVLLTITLSLKTIKGV